MVRLSKLVSFATVVALWTLEILLIKLIRILLKKKHIQDKNYAIFALMLQKRSYFVQEIFVPVTRAGVWIRENFHSGLREISVPASDKNISRPFRNGIVARRDLGNRASPVDRAYIKEAIKVLFMQVVNSVDLILSL